MIIDMRQLRNAACALLLLFGGAPAGADIVLSDLIVDLQAGKAPRDDIEVWNNGTEREYVAIQPREILHPGTANEAPRIDPDPEQLGLLVTPARMVLEPGQRKIIRIASLAPPESTERVYRVTVKPVVGGVQSNTSGLKILVGYDVLVLVRPQAGASAVSGVRSGRTLTFTNAGNMSVELTDGRQCDPGRVHCIDVPGKRLYAGGSWTEQLNSDLPVEYTVKEPNRALRRVF